MQKIIVFENNIEQIPRLESFVEEIGETLCLPFAVTTNLNLALEEAVVNVIEYAYPKGEKNTFTLTADAENGQLKFSLVDHGTPFNPLKAESPDITLSAEERPIGGLGIMLVKKIMDSVDYKYVNNENVFTMIKKY